MCLVSAIGDSFSRTPIPQFPPQVAWTVTTPPITRAEFDALKKSVEDIHKLLLLAKKIDERLGTPDCEMEEKVATLRKIAEYVGVSLEDVFPPANAP